MKYHGMAQGDWYISFETTSDGLGISFISVANKLLEPEDPCHYYVAVVFEIPQLQDTGGQEIVNNTFTYNGFNFDITGHFDSATTASGDLNVHPKKQACNPGPMTWTATAWLQ